mmetsp:Transcript_137939/g.440509  ORF Transcript_137939/g.440509 Transcript_137939/m.440509 type:complete len:208 (+) Transcript_137939:2457-3080(+)
MFSVSFNRIKIVLLDKPTCNIGVTMLRSCMQQAEVPTLGSPGCIWELRQHLKDLPPNLEVSSVIICQVVDVLGFLCLDHLLYSTLIAKSFPLLGCASLQDNLLEYGCQVVMSMRFGNTWRIQAPPTASRRVQSELVDEMAHNTRMPPPCSRVQQGMSPVTRLPSTVGELPQGVEDLMPRTLVVSVVSSDIVDLVASHGTPASCCVGG